MDERVKKRYADIIGFVMHGMSIPPYMAEGLAEYIENGQRVGDFLQQVISDNLMRSVEHADGTNIRIIPIYPLYLFNRAPRGCHGSLVQYERWIERGGLRDIEARNGGAL